MKSDPLASPRAVLGPTNTGKTHYAVERMLAHSSGMIGFPLRLLAREIYDRCVRAKGAENVALITGEEKIVPKDARYFCCTVESMPVERSVAFLAIDEAQLAADPARGHVFTDRILHARGREETLFLGSGTILPRLHELTGDISVLNRPRFSDLSYAAPVKLSRLPRRSIVVAFSAEDVYALAEAVRRLKGGAAIVMGALSPKTRNAQVALYQAGEVDYLVATDAVGMGLNLDVDHVAFAALRKFDGTRWRDLSAAELGQIAGRAGRHRRNGTFGTLSGGEMGGGIDPATVSRLEEHRFEPLKTLFWRNRDLDFRDIERLIQSLEARPILPNLIRAREAGDLNVLKVLSSSQEIREKAANRRSVELLWDVCQIPDYRKLGPQNHAQLVKRLFDELSGPAGMIGDDFISAQVRRLDDAGGEITQIAQRIASIRIWTYVSHRRNWLRDPEYWAGETRRVEDRLSDALHDALTRRFVDRRTSVLMRGLNLREDARVLLEDTGEIIVEGHVIGRLLGFSFHPKDADSAEQRALTGIAEATCKEIVTGRLQIFGASPDDAFQIVTDGGILHPEIHWRGAAVAKFVRGESALRPKLALMPDSLLDGAEADYALDRLYRWLGGEMVKKLGALAALDAELREEIKPAGEAPPLSGLGRGIAFRLVEHMGVMPRETVAEDIRQVPQEERKGLRRHHVRIGMTTLYIPELLKPAPTALRLILWALFEGPETLPPAPTPGMVWAIVDPSVPHRFYEAAGYRVAGPKAIRIDMLERLADAVRPLGEKRDWFAVTPEIMGLVGCSGDDFAAVMRLLGYKGKSVPADHPDARTPSASAPQPAAATEEAAPAAGEEGAAGNIGNIAAESPVEPVEAASPEVSSPEIPSPEILSPEDSLPESGAVPALDAGEETEERKETADAAGPAGTAVPQDAAGPQDGGETEAATAAGTAPLPERMVFQWAPKRVVEQKRHGDQAQENKLKDETRRPRRENRKHDGKEGGKEGRGKAGRDGGRPGRDGAKRSFAGEKPDRGNNKPAFRPQRPERREKQADPLSPFAALSVLLKK